MREIKTVKIKGREFISGGEIMPDAILNFAPDNNLQWFNRVSQKRWYELKNQDFFEEIFLLTYLFVPLYTGTTWLFLKVEIK